ncbi:unnamed protein product, partial [Polarella glacialis]
MPAAVTGEVWESLIWAFCVLAVLLFSNVLYIFSVLRRKSLLFVYGMMYLALSKDSNFQLPPDPGKSKGIVLKTKRIVFVRHAESAWNACFNRGLDPMLPIRILV